MSVTVKNEKKETFLGFVNNDQRKGLTLLNIRMLIFRSFTC